MPGGCHRHWPLIAVAHEEGKLNDLRAILGNDIAIKAFRKGNATYPDGTIIARLAWGLSPVGRKQEEAFGAPQSFVARAPESNWPVHDQGRKKYASTGGWGYVEFDDSIHNSNGRVVTFFDKHIKERQYEGET